MRAKKIAEELELKRNQKMVIEKGMKNLLEQIVEKIITENCQRNEVESSIVTTRHKLVLSSKHEG